MELGFEFRGIKFPSCLMNASGPSCATLSELEAIGKSKAGAIVLKSATVAAREGNPEPRYFENELGSINSMGLPNPGYKEFLKIAPKLKQFGKPIIASISGLSKEGYIEMVKAYAACDAIDMLEINLSCPNIEGKPQVGYDFEYSKALLKELRPLCNKPMSIKLPPYLDLVHRSTMAEIARSTGIDAVVLVNSLGNALLIDAEKGSTAIKPKKGLGGLGGKYIKPVALGNVWSFYQLFKGELAVMGAGGVYSGQDVFEHLLAGANLVQVGTAYESQGAGIFERLEKELAGVLQKQGYDSAQETVGKLKTLD